jgi:hypothetical protein
MSHFLHQRCNLRDYYTLVSASVKHEQILYFILWLTNILYLMVFEARHPKVFGHKFTSRTLVSSHFSSHRRSPSRLSKMIPPCWPTYWTFPYKECSGGVWQLAAGFLLELVQRVQVEWSWLALAGLWSLWFCPVKTTQKQWFLCGRLSYGLC